MCPSVRPFVRVFVCRFDLIIRMPSDPVHPPSKKKEKTSARVSATRTQNTKSETRNTKHETRNPKPKNTEPNTRSQSKTQNPKQRSSDQSILKKKERAARTADARYERPALLVLDRREADRVGDQQRDAEEVRVLRARGRGRAGWDAWSPVGGGRRAAVRGRGGVRCAGGDGRGKADKRRRRRAGKEKEKKKGGEGGAGQDVRS